MAITADEIQNISFTTERRGGYSVEEVDVFLERVAEEVDNMNMRIEALVAELDEKEAALEALKNQPSAFAAPEEPVAMEESDTSPDVAALKAQVADLQEQLAEKKANDSAISQALIVAQRSADEVVANARAEASNIIKDADEEADRIIGKAESDRLKITEAIRSLEAERSDVRAEYRDMLANFMADAQKKLAEIDGDARRANVSAQARNEANESLYAQSAAIPASEVASASAPGKLQFTNATAPSASGYIDKDFSGFGAADSDFEFDDID